MKNSQIHKMTQNPIIIVLCFLSVFFSIEIFYSQILPINTALSVFFIMTALHHELYNLFFIII